MNESADNDIATSWEANALAWAIAVRTRKIASRRVTDKAIFDHVARLGPRSILDAGCGEGWLAGAFAAKGCAVTGFDGAAELVALAREAHPTADFHAIDYETFAKSPSILRGPFDVAVCNFSLFAEHLTPLLGAIRERLAPDGRLAIQTLHPDSGGPPYTDGWRIETFSAFQGGAWEPMRWYYRTKQSWIEVLRHAQFEAAEIIEPLDEPGAAPLSLILSARLAR